MKNINISHIHFSQLFSELIEIIAFATNLFDIFQLTVSIKHPSLHFWTALIGNEWDNNIFSLRTNNEAYIFCNEDTFVESFN